MKFLAELETILKKDGSPELAARLLALAKPGVLLQKRYEAITTKRAPLLGLFKRSPRKTRRGLAVAPGASRLGGLPELAEGQSWPTHNGRPMQFLAQINCAEFSRFRDVTLLPNEGILHFFQADCGMESRVTLSPANAPLTSVAAPENVNSPNFVLAPFPVESVLMPTYPDPEMQEFKALGLSEEDEEALFNAHGEIIENIRLEEHGLHHIGGYPEPVQGNVFTECEKKAGGRKQTWQQAAENADRWKLLLQFDTDGDLDVMWGDAGTIYFCIPEEDLRAGRFDKVCSTMQCG